MECAHINHDRDSGYYDDPENGLLVTVEEHLYDDYVGHLSYRGMPVDENGLLPNGLSPEHNEYAISKLLKRQPKAKQLALSLD